jgi:hypothetical protein
MPRKNKKKKKNSSATAARSLQRRIAKLQGFYDGRFRSRTVLNKKKEASRKLARKKMNLPEE